MSLPRPTRWSYSSLSTYRQCPAKWKYSYIDNLEWPSSPAMSRGTRMHLMAEEYVKGIVEAVPAEVAKIAGLLKRLRDIGAKTEVVWLLNDKWEPVEDQREAWIKAVIDVHYLDGDILHVKDYKSGQMYPDHLDQLELYGLIGLQTFPEAKRVETSAIYMDINHEGNQGSILRGMTSKMIEPWDRDARMMMADEVHQPRPSPFNCKYCPYSKKAGGPCGY